MLLAEVAPAAPALAGLLEIAVLLFAFAFVWTIRKLIAALFGWLIDLLELIPVLGDYLASPFHAVEQAVANALGEAEHAIDHAIGASWHLLARYCEWMWREIRGHAVLLLEIASSFTPLAVAIRALRALVHHQHAAGTVTSARVKTLEREYVGIEHQVKALERELRGIDEVGVRRQLRQVERDIATIEAQTIPAIQAADEQAASAISNLYEWAKGKASLLGIGTFSLAVATALDALGLGGLRCNNNPLKNKGCGSSVWGDLESLLLGAAVFGAAVNLGEIVQASVAVEQDAAGAILALVNTDSSFIQDAAKVVGAAANAVST